MSVDSLTYFVFIYASFVIILEFRIREASGATGELLVRLLIPMHWDSVYCTDVILSFPHGLSWAQAFS